MVMQTAAIVEESDGASFLIDNTIFITHGTADMSLKSMQVKENVAFCSTLHVLLVMNFSPLVVF